ncbi:MAG: SDR family oxidoreductase [Pseudomonas sp.]
MANNIEGKVALITGASSGIGAATAAALLDAGAKVVVTARRVDRLRQLGEKLGAGDDRFLAIAADIRNEAELESLIAKTLEWGGRLDILLNNAGLSRGNSHETISPEDIHLILDTNVFALSNLSRLAIPALKKSKGDIINISSTAAISLIPGTAVYAASKAAVAAFSEVLRKELCGEGVRVTTIYPGLVKTEFFDAFEETKKANLMKMAEAIEALDAQDLADTILFTLTRPAHVNLNEIVIRPTKQQ